MTAPSNAIEPEFAAALCEVGIGAAMHALAANIYPICRSITGNGVRETLAHLSRLVPLEVQQVPSGTEVFDWAVPREWNIRAAHIKNTAGRTIVDLANHALHVVGYSAPVNRRMPLAELKRHIHTLPDQPDLIPYRTSYYAETWGFCMKHSQLANLPDGDYDVLIDSEFTQGALTYGEFLHRGETADEVLLSAHICHPQLANDNCSGLALLSHLAQRISRRTTRLSYRFLFAPGTIGAIAWLHRNEAHVPTIRHGLVVSCIGDGGGPVYKRSRRGDTMIDRAMTHVLKRDFPSATIHDFSPYGYDERQFCSPAFDMPVGLIQRSEYGQFPQYHTSADDMDFVTPRHLEESYRMIVDVIDILEHDVRPVSLSPKCEPQLGKRGLYGSIGGDKDAPAKNMAMLWVLNLADGRHTLLDITERSGMPFALVKATAARLVEHGLLAIPDA